MLDMKVGLITTKSEVCCKPLCNLSEENFEVILLNENQLDKISGNKTYKNSKRIAKLLLAGLEVLKFELEK